MGNKEQVAFLTMSLQRMRAAAQIGQDALKNDDLGILLAVMADLEVGGPAIAMMLDEYTKEQDTGYDPVEVRNRYQNLLRECGVDLSYWGIDDA